MRIRSIHRADLRRCAKVFVAVFSREPWNEDWRVTDVLTRLEELYRTPGFYGVIACTDEERVSLAEPEQVLGFAMGYAERWKRGRHFYLTEICVMPHRQRRGVGTAIMGALCQDLAEMDVEAMYLLTLRDSPAEAFYEQCGFNVNPKMILMGKWLETGGRIE
jgi:aminoglycoside 6'-N-acetyltransferase I